MKYHEKRKISRHLILKKYNIILFFFKKNALLYREKY